MPLPNLADLRKKLNELKTGKKATGGEFMRKFYSPPEFDASNVKRSTIRILPGAINAATGENEQFFTETALHKINMKNVHCPRVVGQPCPVCEQLRVLWASGAAGNEADMEAYKEMKAKKRYYMNVIARERVITNEETGKEEIKTNDGPLIYSCGQKVLQLILTDIFDEETGDITDLQNGFDFKVAKGVGQGGFPNYDSSKSSKRQTAAGSDEEIERWMQNLNDLKAIIKHLSYDELLQEVNVFKENRAKQTTGRSAEDDGSSASSADLNVSVADDDSDESFLNQLEKIRKS